MIQVLSAVVPRLLAAVLAALLIFAPVIASAQVIDVRVDISQQRMTVTRHGSVVGVWPVSTARAGKVTPTGTFQPQVMIRMHYSSLYNNAPMPWSIFYSGNYAIHGTNQTAQLGSPASAGCVRLHPDNARTLYEMVQQEGMAATRIRIQR